MAMSTRSLRATREATMLGTGYWGWSVRSAWLAIVALLALQACDSDDSSEKDASVPNDVPDAHVMNDAAAATMDSGAVVGIDSGHMDAGHDAEPPIVDAGHDGGEQSVAA